MAVFFGMSATPAHTRLCTLVPVLACTCKTMRDAVSICDAVAESIRTRGYRLTMYRILATGALPVLMTFLRELSAERNYLLAEAKAIMDVMFPHKPHTELITAYIRTRVEFDLAPARFCVHPITPLYGRADSSRQMAINAMSSTDFTAQDLIELLRFLQKPPYKYRAPDSSWSSVLDAVVNRDGRLDLDRLVHSLLRTNRVDLLRALVQTCGQWDMKRWLFSDRVRIRPACREALFEMDPDLTLFRHATVPPARQYLYESYDYPLFMPTWFKANATDISAAIGRSDFNIELVKSAIQGGYVSAANVIRRAYLHSSCDPPSFDMMMQIECTGLTDTEYVRLWHVMMLKCSSSLALRHSRMMERMMLAASITNAQLSCLTAYLECKNTDKFDIDLNLLLAVLHLYNSPDAAEVLLSYGNPVECYAAAVACAGSEKNLRKLFRKVTTQRGRIIHEHEWHVELLVASYLGS